MLFEGSIVGTREGTVLTAVFTGMIVNFFVMRFDKPLNRIMCK